MSQPDEDLTELSARNKESEDVTVLSSRVRVPAVADDEDDDQTRMSSRATAGQQETADITRLSRRSAAPSGKSLTASGRRTRREMPPGAPPSVAAERGTFGQPAQEYEPRPLPESVTLAAPEAAVVAPQPPAPGAGIAAARSRQEAARHRRLITAVIVVGVTTAIMTAALLGIIALVRGQ